MIELNVKKVLEYASAWCMWFNDGDYYREGDNCTNFVSQCWNYGGVPQNSQWANTGKIYTPAWSEVGTFDYYMTVSSQDIDKRADREPIADEFEITTPLPDYTDVIQPGDIVQTYNGSWHHSIIIMEQMVDGVPLYCAHTRFANYELLTEQFPGTVDNQNSKIRVLRARHRTG